MRRNVGVLAPLAASVLLGAAGWQPPASAGAAPGTDERPPAVLLELFTSQGCSSCPPADRLLRRLGKEPGVIPLSLHVDYWNHLGWQDPFSQATFSRRQRRYARAFAADTVYTPQIVIDGVADVVGSDEAEIRAAIAARRAAPAAARLSLALEGGAEPRLEIDYEVLRSRWRELALMVAVFERGLVTSVPRGENARRTLYNDYVVRSLEAVGRLSGEPGGPQQSEVRLELDRSWPRSRLGVAAFLQAPDSMAVVAAAVLAGGLEPSTHPSLDPRAIEPGAAVGTRPGQLPSAMPTTGPRSLSTVLGSAADAGMVSSRPSRRFRK